MIKHIYILFMLLSLVTFPLNVQAQRRISFKRQTPRITQKHTPGARDTYQTARQLPSVKERKRILDERVERTFARAQAIQERATHPLSYREPIPPQSNYMLKWTPLNSKHIYPDKPFLAHPIRGAQLTEDYILARTNRLFVQHMQRLEAFWPKFTEAIPRFEQEAKALVQPKDILSYTAQQIPEQAKNIFVGEIHNHAEITDFLTELLPLLRQKHPNKPIFLFTEFLTDLHSSGGHLIDLVTQDPYRYLYDSIWHAAFKSKMRIVGLEPRYVSPFYSVKISENQSVSLWATLEGVRLRNDHWWKILEKYRAQNPDAIFIIYTGSGHSFYNEEFSLAVRTPKEETFMLSLTPEKSFQGGQAHYNRDNLEEMAPHLSFPQPVLHWKSKDLAELSGFDMRIKVPSDYYIRLKQLERERKLFGEERKQLYQSLMMP